ncbi:MAG: hypothetical protein ACR2RE_02155, partial [Geminicoccaceae bacterium]
SSRGRRRGGSSRTSSERQPNGGAEPDGVGSPSLPEMAPQPAAFAPALADQADAVHAGEELQSAAMPAQADYTGFAEPSGSSPMMAEAAHEAPAHAEPDDGGDIAHDVAGTDESAEVQEAAIIAEPAEPRRGWWNRFVRKSD